MREKIRVAAYLVLMENNRVLLSQRKNTGWEDGNFSLISGHVEFDESPSSAIVRESSEEAGIQLKLETLECVQIVHRRCQPELVYIDYFFRTARWSGDPVIREPDKCSALEWHPIQALPINTIGYVGEILTKIDRGVLGLTEYGWNGKN
jgi:8-oxo-dGTP diphosphatase